MLWLSLLVRLECILYNVLGKKWVDYISSAHIQRSMTSENDIPVHCDVIIRQVREWIYNLCSFGIWNIYNCERERKKNHCAISFKETLVTEWRKDVDLLFTMTAVQLLYNVVFIYEQKYNIVLLYAYLYTRYITVWCFFFTLSIFNWLLIKTKQFYSWCISFLLNDTSNSSSYLLAVL